MTNQIQRIESNQSVNGVSVWQQVEEANKCTKIMYVKNIRQVLAQKIQLCCALLGVNGERMPKPEEFELMLGFALDFWFNYRIEEIELAVKLNLAGRFENEVGFHGYFDIKFISSLLKEYDRFKQKAMQELTRKRLSEAPNTKHEPDYIFNSKLYDGLIQFREKTGELPQFWDWDRTYQHMEENGMFDSWSIDDKTAIYQAVKQEFTSGKIKARIMAGSISERNEADSIDNEKRIKTECRRRAIEKVLNK